MRFFISSDIRKNRALFYAVVFFMVFALLFWMASWIHFYSKYGFSPDSLKSYFFVDPELGERISLAQISEDLHVGLFLHGMVLVVLFSLLNLAHWSHRFKLLLIFSTSLLFLFSLLSDFIVLFLGPATVFLKLFSFILYQIAFLLVWVLTLYGISRRKNSSPPRPESLKFLVMFFSLFSLLFLFSNFLNFHLKMGFGAQGIRDYFLGNPDLFIRRKSFEGFLKVFYPHLVAMALYVLTLVHLIPFAGIDRKKTLFLGFVLFLFSFLENLSGLFLLYLNPTFAYLKLFSFWIFQLFATTFSLLLLAASLKRESYPSLYL